MDFVVTFTNLCKLSIGEVDYQLRSFLLTPTNAPFLLKMMIAVLEDSSKGQKQEMKNIIASRIITLIGSDILSAECVPLCEQLSALIVQ